MRERGPPRSARRLSNDRPELGRTLKTRRSAAAPHVPQRPATRRGEDGQTTAAKTNPRRRRKNPSHSPVQTTAPPLGGTKRGAHVAGANGVNSGATLAETPTRFQNATRKNYHIAGPHLQSGAPRALRQGPTEIEAEADARLRHQHQGRSSVALLNGEHDLQRSHPRALMTTKTNGAATRINMTGRSGATKNVPGPARALCCATYPSGSRWRATRRTPARSGPELRKVRATQRGVVHHAGIVQHQEPHRLARLHRHAQIDGATQVSRPR